MQLLVQRENACDLFWHATAGTRSHRSVHVHIFSCSWLPEFWMASGRMDCSWQRWLHWWRTVMFTLGSIYVLLYTALCLNQMQHPATLKEYAKESFQTFFLLPWWCFDIFSMQLSVKDSNRDDSHTGEPLKGRSTQFKLFERLKAQVTTPTPALRKWPAENDNTSFSGFKQTVVGLSMFVNDNWENCIVHRKWDAFMQYCWQAWIWHSPGLRSSQM